MPKSLLPIVAALLVPCLIADPALSTGLSPLRPMAGRHLVHTSSNDFQAEALISLLSAAVWTGRTDNAHPHEKVHRSLTGWRTEASGRPILDRFSNSLPLIAAEHLSLSKIVVILVLLIVALVVLINLVLEDRRAYEAKLKDPVPGVTQVFRTAWKTFEETNDLERFRMEIRSVYDWSVRHERKISPRWIENELTAIHLRINRDLDFAYESVPWFHRIIDDFESSAPRVAKRVGQLRNAIDRRHTPDSLLLSHVMATTDPRFLPGIENALAHGLDPSRRYAVMILTGIVMHNRRTHWVSDYLNGLRTRDPRLYAEIQWQMRRRCYDAAPPWLQWVVRRMERMPQSSISYRTFRQWIQKHYESNEAYLSPKTLMDLYAPECPFHPTFRVQMYGFLSYLENTDVFSDNFISETGQMWDWLNEEGFAEEQLVAAFVTAERAILRVPSLAPLDRIHIPSFMEQGGTFHISKRAGVSAFELQVENNTDLFASMLRDPYADDHITCAIGHELGHLAKANGKMTLRPGSEDPGVPAKLKNVFPEHLLDGGREELITEIFNRTFSGESAYQHDLEWVISRDLDESTTEEDPFSYLNRLTYYLALLDDLPDRKAGAAIRDRLALRCEQLRSDVRLHVEQWQLLRTYYDQIIRAYKVKEGVIDPVPAASSMHFTVPWRSIAA